MPEIVHDALATEIGKNGHAVVTTDADAILAAEVDEFWLDIVPGYPEIQYVGKVAIALAVVNALTGERLLARRYFGIRRQQAGPDSPDVRARGDGYGTRPNHPRPRDRSRARGCPLSPGPRRLDLATQDELPGLLVLRGQLQHATEGRQRVGRWPAFQ